MSDQLTINLAGMSDLQDEVRQLHEALSQLNATRLLGKAWYTEREACELKNVPYNTLRQATERRYLPNFGRRTRVLRRGHRQWMYSREQVAAWLPLTAEQIDGMYELALEASA